MRTPGDLIVRRAGRVLTNGASEPIVDGPAAVVIEGGTVTAVVAEADLASHAPTRRGTPEIDAAGRAVIPGFVDAHTHLVFAGDRADEFGARLEGRRYEAGGIMRTVEATRSAGAAELVGGLLERAAHCVDGGTTTIEVKSGYGLDTATEKRCLEAVAVAAETAEAELIPTFLGAHLNPEPGYIDLLIEEMLPQCAPLAAGCDAFCDVGALTVDESRRVLRAGIDHGLTPRLHAEELARTGGAALAAELGCASADHLVHANEADAAALAAAGVVAVLLPATSFCLRSDYANARMFLDAGGRIALATDCNPGTSYTTSMSFVVAVACSEYGLSATEAVRAATLGGAQALRRDDLGRLTMGARADLVVIEGDHWVDIAYHPGMDVIGAVICAGRQVR